MTEQAPETDVVVVGAGNAALVAAISAHEAGARVLVLEAAPYEERGGNSRFAGGIFRCAHDGLADLLPLVTEESRMWADRVDVDAYPVDRYAGELEEATHGRADAALSYRLVHESMETVRWMADRGVRWELTVGKLIDPEQVGEQRYALPPGGALRSAGEGVGLMEDLFAIVEKLGIEIWYDAPAIDLLMDGSWCRGVLVRRADGDVEVRGAVVLAAGGFEANPELRQRWLGPGWDLVKVRGSRFNMGTMLTAAMAAGAQPAGHWGGCHAVPLDADAPDVGDLRVTDKMSRYSYPYALLLNRDARRFVDEGEDQVWLTYAKTGEAIRAQPRAWAFQLFDAKTTHLLEPRYSTGTPVTADTLAEIAGRLGVDADALERTVADFNAACSPGEFDAFSKDGLGPRRRASRSSRTGHSRWTRRRTSPTRSPAASPSPTADCASTTMAGCMTRQDARCQDSAPPARSPAASSSTTIPPVRG